jgi:hypothetical protein
MPSRAKEDRQRSGLAPATKGKDVLLLLLSHLRARILRGKRRPAHPQRRQIERSASESMPTPGNTSISRLPTLRFEREEIASIEAFPSLRDRLHRLSSLGFCSENGVCSRWAGKGTKTARNGRFKGRSSRPVPQSPPRKAQRFQRNRPAGRGCRVRISLAGHYL